MMKKLTAFLLIICVMISVSVIGVSADTPIDKSYILGDADGDGSVNVLDATKIQRLLVDLVTDNDGMIAKRGDVDGDGLNILDATQIQRYLASYETNLPIGEAVYPESDSTDMATEAVTEATVRPPTQRPTKDPNELPFIPA